MQQPLFYQSKLNIHLWWLSAVIIIVNVLLYLYQISHGVDSADPSLLDAIKWGADYPPLTVLLHPQRLVTAMFFHFGFIHLALNMWSLYIFGQVAEQIYGRVYFCIIYFFSGIFGNLLTDILSIHDSGIAIATQHFSSELLPHVGAGASGAVMGLGGALTVLAYLPQHASYPFILSKKSLISIMLLNLAIGILTPNINNTAHMAGFAMGALLTVIWYMSKQKWNLVTAQCLAFVIALAVCTSLYFYCVYYSHSVIDLWQALLSANGFH
ncbi:rhomboid family intramembrane serine protease [Acinetobacter rathckeae]|uniref:rhomboid family intramembrane serine protease n=1 Tax=Acinetobacter rathckeae TaxID=2605272 RepID=UPI0018A2F8F9|nr:rhomboid family intramembrane serine protease [Acinetobacter rathckeae]MBF7687494.1 rhomboid family intramembrane serine protease [Acinetobacter rathckeae]MBF7694895.1 rhomboid family intramembrane serine protease [Acinetobacter rathckeae]